MGKNKKYKLPFVSICTPTYNRRPFIPYTIKCFNHQDYPMDKIEWIIIDDGTDKIEDLHTLAKGLIEYETLSGDEILSLIKDGTINRPDPEEEIKNAGPSVPKSGKSGFKPKIVPGLKPKPQS